MKKVILFCLLFYIPFLIHAKSIMGSDLGWTCVGHDSFVVRLVLYTDCNEDGPGDEQLNFYCKQNNVFIKSLTIKKPNGVDITPSCNESCTRCSNPKCTFPYGIKEYTYTGLVILAQAGYCCEIRIEYSSCCYNPTLTTINNSGNTNFYTEAILNRCVSPCDNSPMTNSMPPVFIICQGMDFVCCCGMQDPDLSSTGGLLDSFGLEIIPPLSARDTSLVYNSPFTYDKPLYFLHFPNVNWHYPGGFHVDNACDISFRPMAFQQQTVFAIKTVEYRNGQKIGEVRRIFNAIVMNCIPNSPPVMLTDTFYKETLPGKVVNYTIPTFDPDGSDTIRMKWNNGIPYGTWTDDNGKAQFPVGRFSWTPDNTKSSSLPYSFNVTIQDEHCPVSIYNTRTFQVVVKWPVSSKAIFCNLDFSVYPNPGDGKFTIHLPENEKGSFIITLTDMSGKVILTMNTDENRLSSEINADLKLEKGIYFIKVVTNGKQGIQKLIVE